MSGADYMQPAYNLTKESFHRSQLRYVVSFVSILETNYHAIDMFDCAPRLTDW